MVWQAEIHDRDNGALYRVDTFDEAGYQIIDGIRQRGTFHALGVAIEPVDDGGALLFKGPFDEIATHGEECKPSTGFVQEFSRDEVCMVPNMVTAHGNGFSAEVIIRFVEEE